MRAILSAIQRGQACPRFERVAAQEVTKLADAVQPREVVETALAMFMMQDLEPNRFRSDGAFRMQLVRRVRGLSDIASGERYDRSTERKRRQYTELTPRAGAVMGQWIAEALGGAGLHLARLERADQDRKSKERADLHKALSELV